MHLVEESTAIACSAAEAFDLISDPTRDGGWRDSVRKVKVEPAAPVAKGSTVAEETSFLKQTIKTEFRVEDLEAGSSITFLSTSTPEPVHRERKVAPEGDGCRVTLKVEVVAGGSLTAVEPLIAKAVGMEVRADLGRLKRLLEVDEIAEKAS